MNNQVILASSSKNRVKLLQALNIPFKRIISNINEKSIIESDPLKRAKRLAYLKAKDIAKKYRGIIIGCDTFTVCGRKVLEKPEDKEEAKKMLKTLSGKTAICYTGFCFLNTEDKRKVVKIAKTKLYFRKIDNYEIEEYIRKFPVSSWAAAYAASELYVLGLINKIEGSLTGFAYGLPLEFLIPLLKKYGYKPRP